MFSLYRSQICRFWLMLEKKLRGNNNRGHGAIWEDYGKWFLRSIAIGIALNLDFHLAVLLCGNDALFQQYLVIVQQPNLPRSLFCRISSSHMTVLLLRMPVVSGTNSFCLTGIDQLSKNRFSGRIAAIWFPVLSCPAVLQNIHRMPCPALLSMERRYPWCIRR